MSGRSARTIHNFSFELWQDLVLHGIRKSTFQPLTVNWNLNCTRNGSQNPPFCPGSPEHLYYFSSISHHQISQNDFAQNKISGIENLKTLVLWPMRGLDRDQFGTRSGWGWDPIGGDPWEPNEIPWEGTPWEGEPLGAQGIPLEGSQTPHGRGTLWEPKGSHGRGPLGPPIGSPAIM